MNHEIHERHGAAFGRNQNNYKRSIISQKPLKRLKKAVVETFDTGLKSGANEKRITDTENRVG